ncbi:MAG: hypothetical protein KC503_33880 [Myxococcales bacterium]|nr:hypothetical protein [Myxococcales bacterium]
MPSLDAKQITKYIKHRARHLYQQPETPLCESHGVDAIEPLLSMCAGWQVAPAVFDELGRYSLSERREHVHPGVARWAARLFCDEKDPDDSGMSAEHLVQFVLAELPETPELIESVFTAIGTDVVERRNATKHLIQLALRGRHRAALPSIRPLWASQYEWGKAVMNIDGGESLADEVRRALKSRKRATARDLALCLAVIAPEGARETLLPLLEARWDDVRLALGYLAHPDDLGRIGNNDPTGKHATRMHVARSPGPAVKRAKALEAALADWMNHGGRIVAAELLCDADLHVATSAAHVLRTYAEAYKDPKAAGHEHELSVLHSIATLARDGADDALWKSIEALHRTVPHAPPLPQRERSSEAAPSLGSGEAHAPVAKPAAVAAARALGELLFEKARLERSDEAAAALLEPRISTVDEGTLLSVAGESFVVDDDGVNLRPSGADGSVASEARRKRVETLQKKVQKDIDGMRSQIAAAEQLAELMTQIAKLESDLGGRAFHENYSEASVKRREKLLLVDQLSQGRFIVRRASGKVCDVASYGRPGRTLHDSLDDALRAHEARVAELTRQLG